MKKRMYRNHKWLLVLTTFILTTLSASAWAAQPIAVEIPCPPGKILMPAGQDSLARAKNDGGTWIFLIAPADGVTIRDLVWSYPNKDGKSDADWGTWTGGDGESYLTWSALENSQPFKANSFRVSVKGKRHCGGGGGGGGGGAIDENFEAAWGGKITTFAVNITGPDITIDGNDSEPFTATAEPVAGTVTGYSWTWSAPAGAENIPQVIHIANCADYNSQQGSLVRFPR